MRLPLLLAVPVVFLSVACNGRSVETSSVRAVVHDVAPTSLSRDYHTARAYAGRRVRVHLPKDTYTVERNEILYGHGDNGNGPILRFLCLNPPPTNVALVVVGVCDNPVRDSIWRGRFADYYLVIRDCVVTVR